MTRLITNGCSYMDGHARGLGHVDLANQLNIDNSGSLAIAGSCNSRIIRTVLKDSYQTAEKTFYIIGLTFLARGELPINAQRDPFEGRWLSTQHFQYPGNDKCLAYWLNSDSKKYIELKNKTDADSVEDRLEHLMYQLLSMINDLTSRGHQVLVFRQPDDAYDHCLDQQEFAQLKKCVNIVDGLKWAAIPWQAQNGVKFEPADSIHPVGIRHAMLGEYGPLNKFLVDYINQNDLHLSIL
jgi:hypothetical protein